MFHLRTPSTDCKEVNMKQVVLSDLLLGWIHFSKISTQPKEVKVNQLRANVFQQGQLLVTAIQKDTAGAGGG